MSLHGANEGWFVTTAFFTDQARADVGHLVDRGNMVLVDGKKLETSIREYWDALPSQWQWRLTECMVTRDRQLSAD